MNTEILFTGDERPFTFIALGGVLEGNFHFSGVVKIAGHLKGPLILEADSELTIERTGHVNGRIEGTHIEIFGTFEGELLAKGKVTLWPSAKVKGPLSAESLVVYPGATLNIEGQVGPTTPTL